MEDIHRVAEIFQNLAKLLVGNPNALTLSVVAAENGGYIFRVHVGEGDAGKLIGRCGRTVRAIRTLLGAFSMQQDQRIRFEIVVKR